MVSRALIPVDQGTGFTTQALKASAWQRGVQLDFTHPGKPADNGHMQRVDSGLRDKCLNVNQFLVT